MSNREYLVELAESYKNVGVTTSKDKFVDLIGPTVGKWDLDRPFRILTMKPGVIRTQGISTCGLVAEGLWRKAGIDVPPSWATYAPKSAADRSIARARLFAVKYGAVRTPNKYNVPKPGDYMCLVSSSGAEHVCTLVGWEDDPSGLEAMVTIDGGQTDHHNLQCIKRVKRLYREKAGTLGDRKLSWYIDIDALPWK